MDTHTFKFGACVKLTARILGNAGFETHVSEDFDITTTAPQKKVQRAWLQASIASGVIHVPNKFIEPTYAHSLVPHTLEGCLAVFEGGQCIGKFNVRDMGMETLHDWIVATQWM